MNRQKTPSNPPPPQNIGEKITYIDVYYIFFVETTTEVLFRLKIKLID